MIKKKKNPWILLASGSGGEGKRGLVLLQEIHKVFR